MIHPKALFRLIINQIFWKKSQIPDEKESWISGAKQYYKLYK
jgi:hypothetical protein